METCLMYVMYVNEIYVFYSTYSIITNSKVIVEHGDSICCGLDLFRKLQLFLFTDKVK